MAWPLWQQLAADDAPHLSENAPFYLWRNPKLFPISVDPSRVCDPVYLEI